MQGVLDTMKSVQVDLSEVTFGALASVLAMLGQMVRLRQVSQLVYSSSAVWSCIMLL